MMTLIPVSQCPQKVSLSPEIFPGILVEKASMERLLERVLTKGDYRAFQQLFKKMYHPLCVFSMKYVVTREIAEEVVSDVFYSIWKNRKKISVSSHRSYLYTSVKNRALDHLRTRKKARLCSLEAAFEIPAEGSTVIQVMENMEAEKQLNDAINSLPKQCKIIFELSRDRGMKYREIAVHLSISIKTVEAQMSRALKHLRKTRVCLQGVN